MGSKAQILNFRCFIQNVVLKNLRDLNLEQKAWVKPLGGKKFSGHLTSPCCGNKNGLKKVLDHFGTCLAVESTVQANTRKIF